MGAIGAEWVLFVLGLAGAGVVAGVLAGLLGIGGGLVFVPALVLLFYWQGVADASVMHLAVGTSLAAIVLTSLSSIQAHARMRNIEWSVFRKLLPGLFAGAVVGAALASQLTGTWLQRAFALFLVVVAIQMVWHRPASTPRMQPGRVEMGFVGGGIGTLSALLGIGGGTLTVPYLAWTSVPVLRAIGTAAAAGLPIALTGAAGFMVTGVGAADVPTMSTGFVWWPAAAVLGVTAMASAPVGARLAHRTDPTVLRRAFAILLVMIAVSIAR